MVKMVTSTSHTGVFTGYQGHVAATVTREVAGPSDAGKTSGTDRAAGDDAGENSRKMQSLQKTYDKKERRVEQRYARESQKLETEYQQQKADLEAELRNKKQHLKVNIYV